MGTRDYGHRQVRKPKKDAAKKTVESIVPPPVEVEVVRKKRKERPEEEL